MGWLSGWAKRIPLTIDHTKVDSDLTDFPVMIKVPTSIFVELGSDANRKKIAVTTNDGSTQCYVEIEYWDTASSEAWLHVKVPSISSSADTVIYLYYDATQADNTTYVGDTGETPAQNVWDDDFVGVWHMSGSSGGAVDSTAYGHNGVFNGDLPTQVDGLVGKAEYADGAGDYVQVSRTTALEPADAISIEAVAKITDSRSTAYADLVRKADAFQPGYLLRWSHNDGYLTGIYYLSGDFRFVRDTQANSNYLNQWHYYATKYDSTSGVVKLCVDDAVRNTQSFSGPLSHSGDLFICGNPLDATYIPGSYDEIRISRVARSDAWLKATHYSLSNFLLSYGSEETGGAADELLVTVRVMPRASTISAAVPVAAKTIRLIRIDPFYDYYAGISVDTRVIVLKPGQPQVPGYRISGTVKEAGAPAARTVRLYRRSSGELVASTSSSAVDGSFEFADIAGDVYFVVAFDDDAGDDYNALIFDRVKAVQQVT